MRHRAGWTHVQGIQDIARKPNETRAPKAAVEGALREQRAARPTELTTAVP